MDVIKHRAVLLVDCFTQTDLEAVKIIINRVADEIERDTDGATITLFGLADTIRKQDIHKLADELFHG